MRKAYDCVRDSIADSLGAMFSESRSILDSRRVTVAIQSR